MDENAQPGRWSRRSMLAGAAAGLVTPLVVNGSAAPFSVAAAAQAKGKLRQVTVYAEALAGGLVGYGLEPGKATIPGPLLEIYEGDTLEIELVNNTDPAAVDPPARRRLRRRLRRQPAQRLLQRAR